jgi:hypothetical protein
MENNVPKEQNEHVNRMAALKWWNNMSRMNMWQLFIKYKEDIVGFNSRIPDNLTGREIELIHKKELVNLGL